MQARNAAADLPLEWQEKYGGARPLATSGVTLTSTLATLTNKDGFVPTGNVDLTLVSHGQSVPVTVSVGGG